MTSPIRRSKTRANELAELDLPGNQNMERSTHRILTTHVGSLVRTPEIIEAMSKASVGIPYDDATFRDHLRKAVADVVRRQAEVGIDIPSDGEFGKRGWFHYVTERFTGFEYNADALKGGARYGSVVYYDRERFDDFYRAYIANEDKLWLPATASVIKAPTSPRAWVNTGKITYRGHEAVGRDIENFKAALRGVTVVDAFMPCVAPCSVEALPPNPDIYKTDEDYVFAVAEALRHEYKAIVDSGLVLQIDDAVLPMHYNPKGSLQDFLKWAALRIEATNFALKGIPADCVRYHICWGSQNVPHTWDVPLKNIVNLLLTLDVGAYSIEAANPRHEHEWQVWEKVKLPEDKILIPGMISHSTNVVEHPELIAWRLGSFARLVGRENVIAGTDCGFSQSWNLIRMHPQVQWAKLEALAEGARLATSQLWARAA